MGTFGRLGACCVVMYLALGGVCARGEISFDAGAALRLRHEYWRNWRDMNDDAKDNRNFFRVRASVWGSWDADKTFSVFLKLTNESKAYAYFAGTTGSAADKSASKKGYHYDINETVFDQLYVRLRQPPGLEATLGRQDLEGLYAESFLVSDGTPGDGSRTRYFNAVRLRWGGGEGDSLDLVYINDPRDEEFLPVINETRLVRASAPSRDKAPYPLNTTDEQGVILDGQLRGFGPLFLEPYFIYKSEDGEGGTGLQARPSDIYAPGMFLSYGRGAYVLRAQIAAQFGTYGSDARRGRGGYIFLDRKFAGAQGPQEGRLGFIYLSGDDRGTPRQEAWDPLFSRCPWISDTLSLQEASETGISYYWTNLKIARLGVTLRPCPRTALDLHYNCLWADEQVAPNAVFSGSGMEKGHLLQGKISYQWTKSVATYFLGEVLLPGDFYRNRDAAVFLRTQVEVKF
ncbi:MAG: hypothetical protein ACM3L6_04800 [Deltaproteobacteria bacterium]